MASSILSFKQEFLDHFGITGFFQAQKNGGQKQVHFPIKKGQQEVLKLFNYGKDERFDREMEIYDRFKGHPGIPVVLAIDSYESHIVVFEEYIAGDTLSDIAYTYNGDLARTHN